MSDKTPDQIEKEITDILESHFWLPSIEANKTYERLHDDHDGTKKGKIIVAFGPDGDAYTWTDQDALNLRFRTRGGGGISPRTRNALLILSLAIKLDAERGYSSM